MGDSSETAATPRSGKPLRVAIATLGRFHVLDLARELAALGYEVRFYSYVPRRRAQRFGLPPECHVALLPLLFPLVALQVILPRKCGLLFEQVMHRAANYAVMLRLKQCDVFIGMSGIYLEAAYAARRRFGARIYLERGSRHILSQREILESIPGAETPSNVTVRRELEGYETADRIVVPSMHAEASFVERGVPQKRLFRNPYGVDMEMFAPTEVPTDLPPTVVFVGTWSLRKGVDILTAALRNLEGVRLLHVGAMGDFPFPDDESFIHVPPIPQWRLREQFRNATVFVLASREDGFGLVISQALACGLPVVCTDKTGGEDIKRMLHNPEWLEVVPAGDAQALAEGIQAMLSRARQLAGVRNILTSDERERLSWRAYGGRYARELSEMDG